MAMPEASRRRFFKVILPDTLQNGTIELPQGFLKKHGESLPKYACLEVPTGAMWKVEMKKRQGRVWLHHGWQDFVEHCSIETGYFIVFRFDGGSFFHVHVFDTSTMEIEYPASSTCTSPQANLDQFENQEVEVGDSEVDEDEEDDDRTSVQKPREFQTTNPYFFITIKPSYICGGCYLHIPVGHANSYFPEKDDGTLRLIGADGGDWEVKYSVQFRERSGVKLVGGWSKFTRENHLREGDVCVFELVERTPMAYKVTVLETTEGGSPRKPTKEEDAKRRVLQRGKAFRSNKPRFMIQICQTHVTRGDASIPTKHARRYLKGATRDQNVMVLHGSNGRTWPVKYNFTALGRGCAKLRFSLMSFISDNQLEAGDVCVFEMIGGKAKNYKVTILRVADYA